MAMKFADTDFRESLFMRLKLLTKLQDEKYLDKNLEWNSKQMQAV